MEFFLLILINIIMGTIFYLILRLRLEKHASDYREKRLKREIDEIISVFNETAERNITILENRIEYLKKLLEKSGYVDKIDLTIDDPEIDDSGIKKVHKKETVIKTTERITDTLKENISETSVINKVEDRLIEKTDTEYREKNFNSISRYYLQIKERLTVALRSVAGHKSGTAALYTKNGRSIDISYDQKTEDIVSADISFGNHDTGRKKENTSNREEYLSDPSINNEEQKEKDLSGELSIIEQMFRNSEDKYLLISELFNEGYSPEIICECSGIPIGEIKLVLDLGSRA